MQKTYNTIADHARQIDELKATKEYQNAKGKLITMDFSKYPNGALPAELTVTYSGTAGPTIGIVNGTAQWVNTSNVSRDAKIIHSTPTATDFQILRGTMSTAPQAATGGSAPRFGAIGRVSADGNSFVWARGYCDGFLSYKGEIGCTVNGVETVWASNISLTWDLSMTMVLGVGTNPRQYQVYSGKTLVYSHTEVGTSSQLGANNRRWGATSQIRSGTNKSALGGALVGSSVSDNEAPAVAGSTARMYRATTSATLMPGGNNIALAANFFTNVSYESPDIDADTATGTFTVAAEGSYYINARLWLMNAISLGGTGGVTLQVFRNNTWSTVAYGGHMLLTTADVGLCGNWIQYLKAGEKVRLATIRGGADVSPLGGDAAGIQTYFAIAGIG